MQVFHYLADQLKDTPLFEATTTSTTSNGFGAIFNDFDNPNPFDGVVNTNLSFSSQSTELSTVEGNLQNCVTVPEVDHAILESDRVEGLWNEDLVFNTDLFHYGNEAADDEYYRKVFLLLTEEDHTTLNTISDRAKRIFEIRHRNGWEMGDTVYDAWLIRNGKERKWFSKKELVKRFPALDSKSSADSSSSNEDVHETILHGRRRKRKLSMFFQGSSDDDYGSESPSMISQGRMQNKRNNNVNNEDALDVKPDAKSLALFSATVTCGQTIVILSSEEE